MTRIYHSVVLRSRELSDEEVEDENTSLPLEDEFEENFSLPVDDEGHGREKSNDRELGSG